MIWLVLFFCVLVAPVSAQTYFSAPPVQLPTTTVPNAGDLMANWNREISDGNAAFTGFQNAINAISGGGTAIPAHAVVAFNSASCPSGWTSFTALNAGRFPRITTGSPAVGTTQGFAMLTHTHQILETGVSAFTGLVSLNTFDGPVLSVTPISNQVISSMATGNSATEVRPVNVALTYCEKS